MGIGVWDHELGFEFWAELDWTGTGWVGLGSFDLGRLVSWWIELGIGCLILVSCLGTGILMWGNGLGTLGVIM